LPLDEFYLDVFMHNGILFSHKEEWNFVIHK
jgi:hypothetical protein